MTTRRMKKRPKSVYTKGWATRRQKKLQAEGMPPVTTMIGADPNANRAHQMIPEADIARAISRTLDIQRDEQLCGFLGDMHAGRTMRLGADHFPVIVSRSQAEAIEQFLSEHGYSPFGKRTGSGGTTGIKAAAKAD